MERQLKEYYVDDVLDFGKYEGYSIKEIYRFAPSYLDWVIIDVDYFYTSLEDLKSLPTPTPMKLVCFKFNEVEHWVTNLFPERDYILEARKYLKLGNLIPEEKFEFSERAIMQAEKKERILLEDVDNYHPGSDNFDDEDFDDYGSSYAKYGGYNGYSDDAIDDAFEGDPSNTWNVE